MALDSLNLMKTKPVRRQKGVSPWSGLMQLVVLIGCGAVLGGQALAGAVELPPKPDMNVRAQDGKLAGYTGALPMKFESDLGGVRLTPRISSAGGTVMDPAYGVNLSITQKPSYEAFVQRSVEVDASHGPTQSQIKSRVQERFAFGMTPRANYLSLNLGTDNQTPTNGIGTVYQAVNVGAGLTVAGRKMGEVSMSSDNRGVNSTGFTVFQPLNLPASVSIQKISHPNAPEETKVSLRLIKAHW